MGGRNCGKALAVTTPIATPTGWTAMGDLVVGDEVFDERGQVCRVTGAYEVRTDRPCYEVVFSDGDTIIADEEHRWLTWTARERKNAPRLTEEGRAKSRARNGTKTVRPRAWREPIAPSVRTTGEIRDSLKYGPVRPPLTSTGKPRQESNHSIDVAAPLQLPTADLPIHPYVLGAWLGDGTSQNAHITIGIADAPEMIRNLTTGTGIKVWQTAKAHPLYYRFEFDDGRRFRTGIQTELRKLGVLNNKHIPMEYLRASEEQRRLLLAGLMDTDGYVAARKTCNAYEMTLCNERLAWDVFEVLISLGEVPIIRKERATLNGIDVGPRYRIQWTAKANSALLSRKAERFVDRPPSLRMTQRRIIDVRPVPSVPVRCIEVDSSSHLYLAGQSMIPTHNTESIKLRALAFPLYHPGKGMLLTAPELNHLRPLTDEVERILLSTRIVRELMPREKSAGIARQPHWQCRFKNGSTIISRLPNKDGKGVKGCIAANVLVMTRRGHIPVQDIVVGDEVLTHKNRWRPVTATFVFDGGEGLLVKGAGHRGLIVSDSHAFYGRRNGNPQRTRNLSEPMWVDAVSPELTRWYWATPTSLPTEEQPGWDDQTLALQYLRGAYLADGYIGRADGVPNRVGITDSWEQLERVAAVARRAGVRPKLYAHFEHGDTTGRLEICSRSLASYTLEHFGEHAHGKRLPVWLLELPEPLRRAFWDGYCAGDGHWDAARERWTVSTASKRLACDLKLLAASLGYVATLSWVDPKVTQVCGRDLKAPARRSYRVTATVRGHGLDDGQHRWGKITSVTRVQVPSFHDLAVEEDHSYVAEGVVQHNQHVINLELDEAQDYPQAGWREVVETLNAGDADAMWRCHGVSRGVRDSFFDKTQEGSGWRVHRPMAMNRPSWSKEERDAKIVEYGGSRQSVDFRRNIYGEHGDASNSVFVLAKLMAVVDLDEASVYNADVYSCTKIEYERFPTGAGDDERAALLHGWIQIPGEHFHGYSQKVINKEVGAPKGYGGYWGGMDVGVTNHPSEILIFGQRTGTETLELLTRVQMHRINTDDQMLVVERMFEIYGDRLRFGIDKTGVGFPLWDQLTRRSFGDRIYGFGFSEKRVVAIEDRALEVGETTKDLAKMRNVVEASTDWLRNDYVDAKRLRLPYDREVLIEFQGQTYSVVRDNGDPYGVRRQFAGGSFHTLDAAKIAIATKHIPPLEELLETKPARTPVLDLFMGA